jgi:hypothetical protein
MASRTPPSIGAEADQLEAEINHSRLTLDQEIGVWSVYGDHGFAPARHVLMAMKEAKSPMQMRQKATMTPADDFDRMGQQIAEAMRTCAMQAGADKTRVLEAGRAFAAQLAPVKGRATITDSGDQSVLPSKAKQAPVDAFAAALQGDLRSDMVPR